MAVRLERRRKQRGEQPKPQRCRQSPVGRCDRPMSVAYPVTSRYNTDGRVSLRGNLSQSRLNHERVALRCFCVRVRGVVPAMRESTGSVAAVGAPPSPPFCCSVLPTSDDNSMAAHRPHTITTTAAAATVETSTPQSVAGVGGGGGGTDGGHVGGPWRPDSWRVRVRRLDGRGGARGDMSHRDAFRLHPIDTCMHQHRHSLTCTHRHLHALGSLSIDAYMHQQPHVHTHTSVHSRTIITCTHIGTFTYHHHHHMHMHRFMQPHVHAHTH
jgi:hypothetical protein